MGNVFTIATTQSFVDWFNVQDEKTKALVRGRFSRIQLYGHFGEFRYLNDGLLELKWKNGLRVYFTYLGSQRIIALLGGTKNGQKKDIKKARTLIGD